MEPVPSFVQITVYNVTLSSVFAKYWQVYNGKVSSFLPQLISTEL